MTAKLIKYDMKARELMLNGVRTLADAVVVTPFSIASRAFMSYFISLAILS